MQKRLKVSSISIEDRRRSLEKKRLKKVAGGLDDVLLRFLVLCIEGVTKKNRYREENGIMVGCVTSRNTGFYLGA